MASKKYDIAVKVGEYKNSAGETKNRYQNVGAVIEGDKGPYILLERWFNPAGVINPDNRGNVILSLFVPKENGSNTEPAPSQQSAPAQSVPAKQDDFEDDIPF